MKHFIYFFLVFLIFTGCTAQKPQQLIKQGEVERILETLSSDAMQGRGVFTQGIERAAQFIEKEFREVGLQPLAGEADFRQRFSMIRLNPGSPIVRIDSENLNPSRVIVVSNEKELNWNQDSDIEIQFIQPGQSFMEKYKRILADQMPAIVFVDEQFYSAFKRLREHQMRERVIQEPEAKPSANMVFVLGVSHKPQLFSVNFQNRTESSPLFNIAGVIPGKSKAKECVIFSAHYDHLGVLEVSEGDSVANGADDNASGVAAIVSLARYYKKLNNNQRTLIFVAFTAEEIGLVGSRYFSGKMNPEDIVAMLNIEMIGKRSKFGANSAFVTGFEKSDLGEILQGNLSASDFKFHPDPYPSQQLFYRSDNVSLAAKGVPAHTISTVQIDKDDLYHTVKDELLTLDTQNITATIKAIALGAEGIVVGEDTPKRIPLPEQEGD